MNTKKFNDEQLFIIFAAGFIFDKAKQAVQEKGFFTLVLSRGTTPKKIYEKLAQL